MASSSGKGPLQILSTAFPSRNSLRDLLEVHNSLCTSGTMSLSSTFATICFAMSVVSRRLCTVFYVSPIACYVSGQHLVFEQCVCRSFAKVDAICNFAKIGTHPKNE